MRDIIFRVSLADCFLVMDCLLTTDYPHHHRMSQTRFLSDRRPHHLIIAFPHLTISVFALSDVFLTRYRLDLPSVIRPFLDERSSLMRRF